MRIKFYAATLLVLALTACGGSQSQNEKNEVATQQEMKSEGYYGTYLGVLPCADCEGIKTTLVIRNDRTYDLVSEYLSTKKMPEPVKTSGVYNMKQSDLIELVTPSSGAKTYYKIVKNTLVRTDSVGEDYLGEMSENYKLTKQQ